MSKILDTVATLEGIRDELCHRIDTLAEEGQLNSHGIEYLAGVTEALSCVADAFRNAPVKTRVHYEYDYSRLVPDYFGNKSRRDFSDSCYFDEKVFKDHLGHMSRTGHEDVQVHAVRQVTETTYDLTAEYEYFGLTKPKQEA